MVRKVKLPPVPGRLAADCRDPGVPEIATVPEAAGVVADTRIWAICERGRKRAVVARWNDIRRGLSGS